MNIQRRSERLMGRASPSRNHMGRPVEETEVGLANSRTLPVTVLIVYEDDPLREQCIEILARRGVRSTVASTTEEALETLGRFHFDAVLTELRTPKVDGLELLTLVRQCYPDISVVVMTRQGTIESAIEAVRLGAEDYIAHDSVTGDLESEMSEFLRLLVAFEGTRAWRADLNSDNRFGEMIGLSPGIRQVYHLMHRAAQANSPVLILGESGTGKELVARSVHFSGPRRDHPFVPIDCSALTPTLIESELFGYVRGAFTGATESRRGLIETAGAGTLFLDEIGDLPLDLQPKLLRALQERETRRLGSNDRKSIAARVIAATNRDLEAATREGKFRLDLYFRLNVLQIRLPALRERKGDIQLLVTYFMDKFADLAPSIRGLADGAMERLLAYHWPGNVRELGNVIERAMALSSGRVLQPADLLPAFVTARNTFSVPVNVPGSLHEVERTAILRAIQETAGDKTAAARLLGIGKTTLYRRLNEYEQSFKNSGTRPNEFE